MIPTIFVYFLLKIKVSQHFLQNLFLEMRKKKSEKEGTMLKNISQSF